MEFHKHFSGTKTSNAGIALFMVMAALTLLTMLVTEFTYVSQVNRKMAYDNFNQLKALYMAKSAFKISLLRIKAYKTIKKTIASAGKTGADVSSMVPKKLVDQVWKFPLIFPIPIEVPGLTSMQKESIQKFTKESGLNGGSFSALIESESGKFNLNLILAQFVPKAPPEKKKISDEPQSDEPDAEASPEPGKKGRKKKKTDDKQEEEEAQFDPEAARESLATYLQEILNNKFLADQDFADSYRDLKLDELLRNIYTWADIHYENPMGYGDYPIPPKQSPFFSVSELHMIPMMDDELYELFAPNLTASTTPGLNVNTMNEATLKALVPGLTDEEVKEFFEFRDSEQEDNQFRTVDDFYSYMKNSFSLFRGSDEDIEEFKTALKQRNIYLVTDESVFKITVQAKVETSTRLLEAWVTLTEPKKDAKNPTAPAPPEGESDEQPEEEGTTDQKPLNHESDIQITFFRII